MYKLLFIIVLCYYYIVKVNFGLKAYSTCIRSFNKMKSFEVSTVSQKRLEDFFDDADSIMRKAKRKKGK